MNVELSFHTDSANMWPHGYWYARTAGHDATGATPLDAVTALANKLAGALVAAREGR